MANWKKIITSGSNAELNIVSASGNIVPTIDNTSDLGATGQEFKDLYIDGVAYLDGAQIGTLGAALDANNQAITNVDINSGAIDGTNIGAASAGTIAGTTIDASTDFTIGGTVITDATITDDGNFTIDAAGDIELNVDGGDVTILDDTAGLLTINGTKVSASAASTASFGDGNFIGHVGIGVPDTLAGGLDKELVVHGAISASGTGSFVGLNIGGGLFSSASLAAAGAVSSVANGVDNRLATFSSADALNGEANLTFDGTNLLIGGTGKLYLNDAGGEHISGDGNILSIAGNNEIDLTATTIDINGAVDISGNTVIGGNLTVNGTTTTVATTNTLVEDQFMFLGTGSAGSAKDIGIMAQSGSVDLSGSALYHDVDVVASTNPNGGRWSVATGVGQDVESITPLQFVTTVKTDTVNPNTTSGSYGAGEMHVNTSTGEIWIRVAD